MYLKNNNKTVADYENNKNETQFINWKTFVKVVNINDRFIAKKNNYLNTIIYELLHNHGYIYILYGLS